MESKGCPKCGADDWDAGAIYLEGTWRDVRYESDEAGPFAFKDRIAARACRTCGYIELHRKKEKK